MKKITLMIFAVFAICWQSQSQVTIGTANDGSSLNSTPVTPYYGFSYSQTIYLASEIGASGDITSLNFQLNPGASIASCDENVDVWIGTTTKSEFASTSDWVPVAGLTQVLTAGTITAANDLLTITFSAPFTYNGIDNLIIAVDANEPGFGTSSDYVWQTVGPANTSLYQRSDSVNADPAAPVAGLLKVSRGNITMNGITQSCPAPTALTATNVTLVSADLGWTQAGSNTNWDIELGLNGFTPTGTPTVEDTSDNPYTASGLESGTTYQFYVRADCGSGETSAWSGPFAFATLCTSVTTFPYLESFESITTGQPNCWSVEGTTTNPAYDFTSFLTGFVGRGMRFDSYVNPEDNTSELITPTFDASSLTTLQLKFYYKNPTGGNFEILVSSDDGATYTSLETDLIDQTDWIEQTYDLTAYISAALKVKFKGTSNYGNGDARIYLDEVLLRAVPSCVEPTAVTATNITTTSVDLDWTAGDGETAWEYALVTSPSTEPASGNAISTNSYVGTLTPSTDYDFYVRADCTGGDFSSWVKISFSSADITPDCATTPFPVDGATDVPAGDLTFSWTAPTTGVTPTSYNLYVVENAAGDNPELVGNFETTSADLTINAYGTTIYWTVLPVNDTAEASGCAIWSFTTEAAPGYCLAASYGQYPAAAYTPSTCDGTTSNNITTIGYAGEYSVVNVVAGQTYQFTSSNATDFVTISDLAGATPLAFGTTPVTWTSDVDGQVRFYTHLNDQCEPQGMSRTRSVLCGATLGVSDKNLNTFTYFPNPVKNELTLKSQSVIQNVSIYNMLGQEVLRTAPNALQSELSMNELQTGTYFVKVTINEVTETIRVIKQ